MLTGVDFGKILFLFLVCDCFTSENYTELKSTQRRTVRCAGYYAGIIEQCTLFDIYQDRYNQNHSQFLTEIDEIARIIKYRLSDVFLEWNETGGNR